MKQREAEEVERKEFAEITVSRSMLERYQRDGWEFMRARTEGATELVVIRRSIRVEVSGL